MSNATEKAPSPDEQGERYYFFICLAALLLLQVVLLARPKPSWALWMRRYLPLFDLWPVLLGGAGLLLRWRTSPLLLLFLLSGLLFLSAPPSLHDPIQDMVLCASVLAFVAGHYRLQSLQHTVFPRDPRQRAGTRNPKRLNLASRQRSGRLVSMEELTFFLLVVLLWVGLATFGSSLVEPVRYPPTTDYNRYWWRDVISDPTGQAMTGGLEVLVEYVWRLGRLLWLLGAGVLVVSVLLNHVLFRRQSREEAALFLQDVVWKETRREQRRINRWLAWVRLRQQRGKEQS
jgi:hypothetical protein